MNVFCEFEDTIIRAEYRAELVLNEKTMKYEQGDAHYWHVTLVDTFDKTRHELKLTTQQFTAMMTLAHGAAEEGLVDEDSSSKMYAICEEFLKDCPVRPIP